MLAKNEGILAPKPLGRGIWRDFYALFPGDLEGVCLIVLKNKSPGVSQGSTPGKARFSTHSTKKPCLRFLTSAFVSLLLANEAGEGN